LKKKRSCKHSLKRDNLIVASQQHSHRIQQKKQFKSFLIFVVIQNRKVAKKELYNV